MAEIQTYLYPQTHRVSFGSYHNPSSPNTIRIPKSRGTEVQFIVVNADGKNVKLDDTKNERLILTIVDRTNNNIILTTELVKFYPTELSESGMVRPTISSKSKIYYTVFIPPSVTEFIESGSHYRWSINFISDDSEQALYANEYLQVEGTVEVVKLETTTSRETVHIDKKNWYEIANPAFLSIINGYTVGYRVYKSAIISTKTQVGAANEIASMLVQFNDFSGRLQLQGCLMNTAPSDDEDYRWFNIKISDMEYLESSIDGVPLDGCLPFNITNDNYMWVRFIALIPLTETLPDTLTKISVRI